MSAQERQDALLRQIAAADDAAGDVFITASSQQGTTLLHDGFSNPGRQIEVGLGDIKALAARGFLAITEYRDQGDVAFVVTPAGHGHADRTEPTNPSVALAMADQAVAAGRPVTLG